MPKNKKAQSTVKDLMIIAIFIFSLSAFTLSVYDHHQIANQNQNKNPTGYFMFHIPHWLHGHNSPNNRNNNMEMPTKMFHPKPYKYNGPLTQQQVVEQTPAYHILKDIYTIINGKYYPITTKEGYINGSLIDLSTLTNKLSKEFVKKSGDVMNGDLNMNNHNIKNVNEIDVKKLCLNGKCSTTSSGSQKLVLKKEENNYYLCVQPNGNCIKLPNQISGSNSNERSFQSLSLWHVTLYGDYSDSFKLAEYKVDFPSFCLLYIPYWSNSPAYSHGYRLLYLNNINPKEGIMTATVKTVQNDPIIYLTSTGSEVAIRIDTNTSSYWLISPWKNILDGGYWPPEGISYPVRTHLRKGEIVKITIYWRGYDICVRSVGLQY